MESFATVHVGEVEYELTPDTVSLWRHMGALAIYDHLYVKLGETNAVYLWESLAATKEAYDALAPVAVEHNAEMHLNLYAIGDVDREAYEKEALSDVGDTIPDDWLK